MNYNKFFILFFLIFMLLPIKGMNIEVSENYDFPSPITEVKQRIPSTNEISKVEDYSDNTGENKIMLDYTVADPAVIQVIIIDSLSGEEIAYGIPGMTIEVSVKVKGPFDNRNLKVELKRDIALGVDTVLETTSFSSITMTDVEEAWFNMTNIVLDASIALFGFSSGQIRKYFVQFIDTTPFPDDIIFQGGDDGTGTGVLNMKGSIKLDYIDYYNVSTSYISINIAKDTWTLTSEVYFRITEAPAWDFSLYVNFKYDVVFGIDVSVVTDQEILLMPESVYGTFLPGLYVYTPLDINSDLAYLYIDDTRTYGTGFGQTRAIFGELQVGDEFGLSLNAVSYLGEQSDASINIKTNLVDLPPIVQIVSPQDGEIIQDEIITVTANIRDPNSNYQIDDILLNGTSVIGDYDPITGNLITSIAIETITQARTLLLELEAFDFGGNTGIDSVYIQVFNPIGFVPDNYQVTETTLTEKLYDDKFSFSALFNYTKGDNLFIQIIPTFSIGLSIENVLQTYISSPIDTEAGFTDVFYAMVSDPMIVTKLNISLDIAYSFGYDDLSFSGSTTLYFEEFVKEWIVPLGIFTFTLSDIIGIQRAETLTHFELHSKDFLPGIFGWLADIVLTLDIINIFKQINSVTADITVDNGSPAFNTITWMRSEVYVIPITSDISSASDIILTLSNFEATFKFGLEIYFQFTLSGYIATIYIGSIDLNKWMEQNLGIIVPHYDKWIATISLPYSDTITIQSNIIGRETSSSLITYIRSDTNQLLLINYTSYDSVITGASIIARFMGIDYVGSDIGGGIYEIYLPLHTDNATVYITSSKIGYESQKISILLNSPTVNFTETIVETITEVSTEISTEVTTEISVQTTELTVTDVSTFLQTKTESPFGLIAPLFALIFIASVTIRIKRRN